MSRKSYGTRQINVGGTTITILGFNDAEVTAGSIVEAMTQYARSFITMAWMALDDDWRSKPRIRDILKTCFNAPDTGIGAGDAKTMRRVLTMTNNGLSHSFDIKIKQLWQADGEVRAWKSDHKKFSSINRASKIAHTIGSEEILFGQIKLDEDFLKDDKISFTRKAKSLIHEATHRFAGTEDKGYMNDDGTAFRNAPGPSFSDALNNADSYAWTVVKIADLRFLGGA